MHKGPGKMNDVKAATNGDDKDYWLTMDGETAAF
jgi:hypothetical protein